MAAMLGAATSSMQGLRLGAPTTSARAHARVLTTEAAHKKGSGSTRNGRDSNAKRLGVKVYGNQDVKSGGIIIRQRGTKFHPGNNVGLGKDYTIYSLIEGRVCFESNTFKRGTQRISVYPAESHAPGNGKSANAEFVKDKYFPKREAKREAEEAAVAGAEE